MYQYRLLSRRLMPMANHPEVAIDFGGPSLRNIQVSTVTRSVTGVGTRRIVL
jgi:hypothetical protein